MRHAQDTQLPLRHRARRARPGARLLTRLLRRSAISRAKGTRHSPLSVCKPSILEIKKNHFLSAYITVRTHIRNIIDAVVLNMLRRNKKEKRRRGRAPPARGESYAAQRPSSPRSRPRSLCPLTGGAGSQDIHERSAPRRRPGTLCPT